MNPGGNGRREMTPFDATRALSRELMDFLIHVPDVPEASVTDALLWRWRAIDPRFRFVNVPRRLRADGQDVPTPDLTLALWILGKRTHLPLVLLAHRFTRTWDHYVSRLAAPDGTRQRLITLTATAEARRAVPFVLLYSLPDAGTRTVCGQSEAAESGVFLLGADEAAAFAAGEHASRVQKNRLLARCDPFQCLFCGGAPGADGGCTDTLVCLSPRMQGLPRRPNRGLPAIARQLAAGATPPALSDWRNFHALGVYDLSDSDPG